MWSYVRRNGSAIFRVYTMYEPLRVFLVAATLAALVGAVVWVRFFVYFLEGHGSGHVQSVIFGSTMLVIAVQLAALGVVADVLAAIRLLLQRTLERVRRLELQLGVEPSHYLPADPQQTPPPTAAPED